ncbi:MAG: Fic family protein [Spirochaetales bacterium]|nr:Fic family protein [Spirochaetales bacterium]
MHNNYTHISFKSNWTISNQTWYLLGQCDAIIKSISYTPIRPDYREKLHKIALIKGAQATTAIEGNTLSYKEIEEIQDGIDLPPSREYLQKEVQNILKGFNTILKEILIDEKISTITPELIQRFHSIVGDGLGETFKAQPGKFRRNNVTVAKYRAPNFEEILPLVKTFCDWLKKEFHFIKGQSFHETIIEAIITHIYIVWIHPFSDGNGRTARLLEYYLLLRAGVPDIASHILSNFYNQTRNEYYRRIELSTQNNDVTPFLEYAVQGFRDGLIEVLKIMQENQLLITWRNYIYGIFSDKTVKRNDSVNDRRRNLILRIPHDRYVDAEEIIELHPSIFKHYQKISDRTFIRDIEELLSLKLLIKENNTYKAHIELLGGYMAFSVKNSET